MDKTVYYHSKYRGYGKNLVLIFLAYCLLFLCNKAHAQIKILFVGDILLSRNVNAEIQSRHTFPWERLKSHFQTADLVVGNLEGAVGENPEQKISAGESPVFSIDSSSVNLLTQAGFNIITVENNHSLDLGTAGKLNTIKSLQKQSITPVSYENSPWFFTIKDTVIALIALNIVPDRDSHKIRIPSIETQQKLRLARSMANIVIVSIHWGSELLAWPDRTQRETAGWLIKNGADVIIGSHPHVIQKPEIIEGKPVFFSLGNHLFDQKYPETKEGLMVEICIDKGEFQCEGFTTHTQRNSFYPEIVERIDFGFKPVKMVNGGFRINNYLLKPMSVEDDAGNKIVFKAYENNRLMWETHPIPVISIESAQFGKEGDLLFLLEKHYSRLDKEINLRPYVYSVDNNGIYARWRGSALAWPVLDAKLSPLDHKTLCVLHRGDSFIKLDSANSGKRIAAYTWNGFGFTGLDNPAVCKSCETMFEESPNPFWSH